VSDTSEAATIRSSRYGVGETSVDSVIESTRTYVTRKRAIARSGPRGIVKVMTRMTIATAA